MTLAWLAGLVRARSAREDVARSALATAQRDAAGARARVTRSSEYLDSLCENVDTTTTAAAFAASAASLNTAAAARAAAIFAAEQAQQVADARGVALREAAIARGAAEQLSDRLAAAERAQAARVAQRELDEVAARVHRDAAGRAG
ncbi:flagellar FliJ family protein [uncultured Jatrophihabitans sp.]|uniref:flagellar FliJ family protein n=1 Tax=uncultured Jatrophihabitans sp. TaxID=1610747 RepID=UPI0035C9E6BC